MSWQMCILVVHVGLCGKSRVVLGSETLNDDEPEWAIKNAFGVVLMQAELGPITFFRAHQRRRSAYVRC